MSGMGEEAAPWSYHRALHLLLHTFLSQCDMQLHVDPFEWIILYPLQYWDLDTCGFLKYLLGL